MDVNDRLAEECLAARGKCVLFDHPNRGGMIEVRGSDRIQFLHNVLSNDIKSLVPGKGTSACLLDAQAKIIANMNVLCFQDYLWLALDYVLKDKLFEALGRLIITEDVALEDRSHELKLISVHGPKAKAFLENVLKRNIPDELLSHISNPLTLPSPFRGEGKGEGQLICIRINLIGEIGYGFLAPADQAANFRATLEEHGEAYGLKSIQGLAMETLRIEAGVPRYGIDFDESNIPLESRLENTISFAKGCFPGQEILARLDSRGGVSKKLVGLKLEGSSVALRGDRVLCNTDVVGSITSGVFSPTIKTSLSMGYVKKEYWTSGNPVVVETSGTKIRARVADLPFYSSDSV